MADRRVTFLISANVQNFTKGLERAQKKFDRFGQSLQRKGRAMTASFTVPLLGAAGAAIKSAADFETLAIQMEVLTGSAEAGAKAFENLKRFSARTPFQLADLTKAQNTLMGFGQSADDAFDSLQMIADIAAVTGGDIQAISVAFGQAAAEGRLMTRDIRQLINQGVPAIDLLADSMGVATDQILDMASEGEITFDVLVKAFRDATGEGGKFADGTDRLAGTLNGLFSTLKDNVSIALAEVGNDLIAAFDIKGLTQRLIDNMGRITEAFTSLSADVKARILGTAALLAAGGPLLIALGTLARGITSLSKLFLNKFTLMMGAAAGLVIVGKNLVDNWENFGSQIKEEMLSWVLAAQNTRTLIQKALSFFSHVGGVGGASASNALFMAQQGVLGSQGSGEGVSILETTKGLMDEITASFQELMNSVAQGTGLADFFEALQGNLSGGVEQPLQRIREELTKLSPVFDGVKARSEEWFESMKVGTENVASNWERFNDVIQEFSEEFQSLLIDQISSSVIQFGETVGLTLSGMENKFATTFEKLVLIVLDFAKSLVKLAAGIGAIMLFIPGLQGAGAGVLAASAALTAGISAVEAGINKRQRNRERRAQGMAMGGIVPPGFPNDTYPAFLSSGETVIPAPQPLPPGGMGGPMDVRVFIDGREVEAAIDERKYKRNR